MSKMGKKLNSIAFYFLLIILVLLHIFVDETLAQVGSSDHLRRLRRLPPPPPLHRPPHPAKNPAGFRYRIRNTPGRPPLNRRNDQFIRPKVPINNQRRPLLKVPERQESNRAPLQIVLPIITSGYASTNFHNSGSQISNVSQNIELNNTKVEESSNKVKLLDEEEIRIVHISTASSAIHQETSTKDEISDLLSLEEEFELQDDPERNQHRNKLEQFGERQNEHRNELDQSGERQDQHRNKLEQFGERQNQHRNKLEQSGGRRRLVATIENVPAHSEITRKADTRDSFKRPNIEKIQKKPSVINVFIPPPEAINDEDDDIFKNGYFVPDDYTNKENYHPGYKQIDHPRVLSGDRYTQTANNIKNPSTNGQKRTKIKQNIYPLGRPKIQNNLVEVDKETERSTSKPGIASFFEYLMPAFVRDSLAGLVEEEEKDDNDDKDVPNVAKPIGITGDPKRRRERPNRPRNKIIQKFPTHKLNLIRNQIRRPSGFPEETAVVKRKLDVSRVPSVNGAEGNNIWESRIKENRKPILKGVFPPQTIDKLQAPLSFNKRVIETTPSLVNKPNDATNIKVVNDKQVNIQNSLNRNRFFPQRKLIKLRTHNIVTKPPKISETTQNIFAKNINSFLDKYLFSYLEDDSSKTSTMIEEDQQFSGSDLVSQIKNPSFNKPAKAFSTQKKSHFNRNFTEHLAKVSNSVKAPRFVLTPTETKIQEFFYRPTINNTASSGSSIPALETIFKLSDQDDKTPNIESDFQPSAKNEATDWHVVNKDGSHLETITEDIITHELTDTVTDNHNAHNLTQTNITVTNAEGGFQPIILIPS